MKNLKNPRRRIARALRMASSMRIPLHVFPRCWLRAVLSLLSSLLPSYRLCVFPPTPFGSSTEFLCTLRLRGVVVFSLYMFVCARWLVYVLCALCALVCTRIRCVRGSGMIVYLSCMCVCISEAVRCTIRTWWMRRRRPLGHSMLGELYVECFPSLAKFFFFWFSFSVLINYFPWRRTWSANFVNLVFLSPSSFFFSLIFFPYIVYQSFEFQASEVDILSFEEINLFN